MAYITVMWENTDYGEYRLEKAYLTTADGPQMRRLPGAGGRGLLRYRPGWSNWLNTYRRIRPLAPDLTKL